VALLVLFVPVAAHLKWTQRGYALLDSHVVTRNGFWSRRTDIVPYHRIQTVIASQTIFQRNRNLATLTIDTAGTSGLTGNDGRAVDIDADVAGELREAVAGELLDSLEQRRQQTSRRRREQLLGGGPTGSGPSTGSPTGSDR
jgi:putative membrane protein